MWHGHGAVRCIGKQGRCLACGCFCYATTRREPKRLQLSVWKERRNRPLVRAGQPGMSGWQLTAGSGPGACFSLSSAAPAGVELFHCHIRMGPGTALTANSLAGHLPDATFFHIKNLEGREALQVHLQAQM